MKRVDPFRPISIRWRIRKGAGGGGFGKHLENLKLSFSMNMYEIEESYLKRGIVSMNPA